MLLSIELVDDACNKLLLTRENRQNKYTLRCCLLGLSYGAERKRVIVIRY